MEFPRDLFRFAFVFAIAFLANLAWPPKSEVVYVISQDAPVRTASSFDASAFLP